MKKKIKAEVYMEAAMKLYDYDITDRYNPSFACVAIHESTRHTSLHVEAFANIFKPKPCDIDDTWFGEHRIRKNLAARANALLLMAEMVGSGDV